MHYPDTNPLICHSSRGFTSPNLEATPPSPARLDRVADAALAAGRVNLAEMLSHQAEALRACGRLLLVETNSARADEWTVVLRTGANPVPVLKIIPTMGAHPVAELHH
jgi:hypothetical protein